MLSIVAGPPSEDRARRTPGSTTPVTPAAPPPSRAKRHPYRCPDQSAAPGDPL